MVLQNHTWHNTSKQPEPQSSVLLHILGPDRFSLLLTLHSLNTILEAALVSRQVIHRGELCQPPPWHSSWRTFKLPRSLPVNLVKRQGRHK